MIDLIEASALSIDAPQLSGRAFNLLKKRGKSHFTRSYAERSRLDAGPCPLSGAEPWTQHHRARNHGWTACLAMGPDVGSPSYRLLALPVARGADRGLFGAAFYDPARLWSWGIFSSS